MANCEDGCIDDVVVLSSVHLGVKENAIIGENTVQTEFSYTIPHEASEHESVQVDDDGDMDVPRKPFSCDYQVAVIEHTMATPISRVGTQLWSGSLLLADYIIHQRQRFISCSVLELGSGVGLVGVVTSHWARHVFCTDVTDSVLNLCWRNVERNIPCLAEHGSSNVIVRELDWNKPGEIMCDMYQFSFKEEDLDKLKSTSFVLAADVVYDDSLTDAFFSCLVYLVTHVFSFTPVILISLERRINFTLEHLAPASPTHSHFLHCLLQEHAILLPSGVKTRVRFVAHQLPVSFPQSFKYERTGELELWELSVETRPVTT